MLRMCSEACTGVIVEIPALNPPDVLAIVNSSFPAIGHELLDIKHFCLQTNLPNFLTSTINNHIRNILSGYFFCKFYFLTKIFLSIGITSRCKSIISFRNSKTIVFGKLL